MLDFVEVLGFRKAKVKTLVKDITDIGVEAIMGWSFLEGYKFYIDTQKKILEFAK